VALMALAGPVDTVVGSLATDLGTTAYELRLTLGAGFPAVVLATTDEARAASVERTLRARGHRVVSCARREVVPSSAMTVLRDFELRPGGVAAVAGAFEVLPYDDLGALLRASHRAVTETTTEVKERKFRPGMALATGGLVLSKTTTKEVTSRTEEREQVLYLFRRSGAPPWLLRERSARYGGLGAELGRTSLENFATLTKKLRGLAPSAFYDERLMSARAVRGVAEGADAADLLAHLLAMDAAAPLA
jgi:hypothetical protein